jgi:hypothetical protein
MWESGNIYVARGKQGPRHSKWAGKAKAESWNSKSGLKLRRGVATIGARENEFEGGESRAGRMSGYRLIAFLFFISFATSVWGQADQVQDIATGTYDISFDRKGIVSSKLTNAPTSGPASVVNPNNTAFPGNNTFPNGTSNPAMEPVSAEGYYYIADNGSDSNDGLSLGTAFATPQHCNAVAIANGDGICDARAFHGYRMSTEIDVGNAAGVPVVLLLPNHGRWRGTMTDGTSYVLKVFNQSSVIGMHSGLGQAFFIDAAPTANVDSVCGTNPLATADYVRMSGFSCQAAAGATVVNAVLNIKGLADGSRISEIGVATFSTLANKVTWLHGNLCCGARIYEVNSLGNGLAGAVPCTFGDGTGSMGGAMIDALSCVRPGNGKNAVARVQNINDAGAVFGSIYMEIAAPATDTTTAMVGITGSGTFPDVFGDLVLGIDIASSTRYIVDIGSTSKVILKRVTTATISPNAINDHSNRSTIIPGAGHTVVDYDRVGFNSASFATWYLPFGFGCKNTDLALSAGWGTTATVTAVYGVGQTCGWTITSSGTGQAANPTITETLFNPLPVTTPVLHCDMRMTGGTGTYSMIDETTVSATVPVFTFLGTPVAASTYKVLRKCG